MAKKPKTNPEEEDKTSLLLMMWGEGSFESLLPTNAAIARFADYYWQLLVEAGHRDHLSKTEFFKALLKLPVLSPDDRCRSAINTVIRMRNDGVRAVGTLNDLKNLRERLVGYDGYRGSLCTSVEFALNGDVYACAVHAAAYGPVLHLTARQILSSWVMQR